ncbi:MAG: hypothetical protein V4538_00220 [Bacteroidota bacterium]
MFLIIKYISIFSILPAAVLAVGRFKYFLLKDVKLLAIIILFSVLGEITSFYANKFHYSNPLLPSIHSVLELLLICLYFTAQPKFNKYRLPYLIIWFCTSIYMLYAAIKNPALYPSEAKVTQSIFIVCMCIFHAYKWLTFETAKLYEILVILAFSTYYIITLSSFMYANRLPTEWNNLFWMLNDLFGIAANISLFLALHNYLTHYGFKHQQRS